MRNRRARSRIMTQAAGSRPTPPLGHAGKGRALLLRRTGARSAGTCRSDRPGAIPRRAGAGDRQAGRDSGACGAGRRPEPRTLVPAAALRPAAAAGAGAPARPRHVGLSRARPAQEGAAAARPAVRRGAGREGVLGGRLGHPARARGAHRGPARETAARHGRLAHGGGAGAASTPSPITACSARRTGAPGSNCGRAPGARTRSACIAPRSDVRWSATRLMAGQPINPLQLHARAITLPLYPAKPPIAVTAPVPPHMLFAADGARLSRRRRCCRAGRGGVSETTIAIRRPVPGRCRAVPRYPPRRAGPRRRTRSPARSRTSARSRSHFLRTASRRCRIRRLPRRRNCWVSPDFTSSRVRSTPTRARCGACMSGRRRAAPGSERMLVEAVIDHARRHVELLQLSVISENAGGAPALSQASGSRNTESKGAPPNIAAAIMTMC